MLLLFLPSSVFALGIEDFNPVSHWTCDETSGVRYDSNIVSGNDLTDNNTVLYGSGLLNNACDFELTNSEYLSINDVSQTGLDFTTALTFSAWVKPESLPTDDAMALMYKWSGSNAQYGALISNSGGTNRLRFITYGSCSGGNTNIDYTYTVSTAEWTHLVFTYDAGSVKFYVDGSLGGTTGGGDSSLPNCSGVFTLGDLQSGVQWFYDGLLDEVSIFDYVLSASEVTSLYNSGTPLDYVSSGGGTTTATSTATSTSISAFADDAIKLGGLSLFGLFLLGVIVYISYLVIWTIRA